MFTEREQEYLKGLVLSALHIMQKHDFRSLSAAELKNEFNDCLDDYFFHFPLNEHPDNP